MRTGFPLLTTKSISWKNIVIENLWFLSGQTDISLLQRHGCKFWDPWADEHGKVPSAYGNFWRAFPVHGVNSGEAGYGRLVGERYAGYNDQLRWVLDEMRRNPMSRRMVVSAWAPGNAQTSKLPPCHCLFAFNVQNEPIEMTNHEHMMRNIDQQVLGPSFGESEKAGMFNATERKRLCLHLTQRSCDTALGVPYNLAGYAFLLQVFAQLAGLDAGIFGHTLIDAHIYTSKPDGSKAEFDHVPGLRTQCARQPKDLPKLTIDPTLRDLQDIEALMDPKLTTQEVMSHFVLDGYDPHPAVPFKVAV
jgi:thymidylate synthase